MNQHSFLRSILAASVACLAVGGLASADSLVVGGFNATRGGVSAIAGGSVLTQLRSSITAAFPGTTFTGTATLTEEYLGTIDILFIASATGGVSAISPLSAAEIAATRQFIERGGTAVLVMDNDTFAGGSTDLANESLGDIVGLDVVGTGSAWPQSAAIAHPELSPVTSGPYGTVTNWLVGWSGWFNHVPTEALVLGVVVQSNQPGLVVFPRHSLAACSGAVVALSDMTAFVDGYYTIGSVNYTLILNTIAYVAAPSCTVGQCGDLDGDLAVDGADLGAMLAAWGSADPVADLDANGAVDGADLGILLVNWGPCGE